MLRRKRKDGREVSLMRGEVLQHCRVSKDPSREDDVAQRPEGGGERVSEQRKQQMQRSGCEVWLFQEKQGG